MSDPCYSNLSLKPKMKKKREKLERQWIKESNMIDDTEYYYNSRKTSDNLTNQNQNEFIKNIIESIKTSKENGVLIKNAESKNVIIEEIHV